MVNVLMLCRQEMSVMKQVVLNLSQRRVEPDNLKPASASQSGSRLHSKDPYKPSAHSSRNRSKSPSRAARTRTAVYQPKHYVEAEFDDANVHKPPPTEFVSYPLALNKKSNGSVVVRSGKHCILSRMHPMFSYIEKDILLSSSELLFNCVWATFFENIHDCTCITKICCFVK